MIVHEVTTPTNISLVVDNSNVEENNTEGWVLKYEFPDQSLTFSRGFCLGRFWEALKRHHVDDFVILTTWAQDAINVARAQGWIARAIPMEQDASWSTIVCEEFKLHLVHPGKTDETEDQV